MVTKLNKPNYTKSTNRNSNNKISSRIPKNNRKMKIEEGKNGESKIRKVLNTVKNKRGDLVGLKRIKMTKKMKILSQYQTRSTTPVMTIVSLLINRCSKTPKMERGRKKAKRISRTMRRRPRSYSCKLLLWPNSPGAVASQIKIIRSPSSTTPQATRLRR